MKVVTQYLSTYAEPEAQTLLSHIQAFEDKAFKKPSSSQAIYDHVLLIPCYRERPDFLKRIQDSFANHNLLLICVVNRPDHAETNSNQLLLNWVEDNCELKQEIIDSNTTMSLHKLSACADLLLVNRDAKPIPAKQGVGLARKIGADCAVILIHEGFIASTIIASSDADAHLPPNYFDALDRKAKHFSETQGKGNRAQTVAAFSLAFEHQGSLETSAGNTCGAIEQEQVSVLTQWYEAKLNHYVLALRSIQSPYAFHTIGSCIAFNHKAYCQVRGFPKRAAGEDFYLLNKLAKVGAVVSADQPLLGIGSRFSDRVPFGTGPAITKLKKSLHSNEAELSAQESNRQVELQLMSSPLFYNPRIFPVLATVHRFSEQFLQENPNAYSLLSDSQSSLSIVKENDLQPRLEQIVLQYKTITQRLQAYHAYFDAFKTMKAVHTLRDSTLPNVNFTEIAQAEYLDKKGGEPREHFKALKRQLWPAIAF